MAETGYVVPESEKAELPYDMWCQAKEVYLVPKMRGNILLSIVNLQRKGMCWYIIRRKSIFMIPPPQTSILLAKQY